MKKQCFLDEIHQGEFGIVKRIDSVGSIRRRLLDMGLVEGTKVETVLVSPGGDPIAYLIRGALIAIRNEDAHMIVVEEL